MLEIRITAPELTEAINNLATALSAPMKDSPVGAQQSAVTANTAATACEESTCAIAAPVPNEEEIPVEVPVVPTAYVPRPTAPAPQYTLDAIAKAGSALVDAGRINEVTALLAKYGVEILTALDPSKYGEFATDLRALGAQI